MYLANKFSGVVIALNSNELPGDSGTHNTIVNQKCNIKRALTSGLANIQGRAQLKRRKYEDTLALFAEQGWEPILITIILGTLGEITVDTGTLLSEHLGVRRERT
eukprot:2140212-Pyramimonas_sp.AAC.1